MENYSSLKNFLQKYLNEDIIELKLFSRLIWKNVVFYCKTQKEEYAIKVFKPIEEIDNRYKIESFILKNGKNIFRINLPNVLYELNYNKHKIIVMNWINGKSIKQLINEQGLTDKNIKILENYIKNLEKIWNYDYKNTQIEKILKDSNLKEKNNLSTIYTRIYHEPKDAFEFCSNNTNISIKEIMDFYNKIALKNKNKELNKNIINSDISLHEVILNDKKEYWIDFENFVLGDINNDLAGIFYSASTSIYKNKNDINKLFDIITKNNYYNKEIFAFYLIERVVCAYYINHKNTSIEEFEFFINFIKNIR